MSNSCQNALVKAHHVVIMPRCRRMVFCGRLRQQIDPILCGLYRRREIELLEGHAMPAPCLCLCLCLCLPSRCNGARVTGFLNWGYCVNIVLYVGTL